MPIYDLLGVSVLGTYDENVYQLTYVDEYHMAYTILPAPAIYLSTYYPFSFSL